MERKPFHESVVDDIRNATAADMRGSLGRLLKTTKIPANHRLIIGTWTMRRGELGLGESEFGVVASLLIEEDRAAAEARQKGAETAKEVVHA